MQKVRLSLIQLSKKREKLRDGKISDSLLRVRRADYVGRTETSDDVKPRKGRRKGALERRQVTRTANRGEDAGCEAPAPFAYREVMDEDGTSRPEGLEVGLELNRCKFSVYCWAILGSYGH